MNRQSVLNVRRSKQTNKVISQIVSYFKYFKSIYILCMAIRTILVISQDQIGCNYNIVYRVYKSLTISNKISVLLSNQIEYTFEENSFQ